MYLDAFGGDLVGHLIAVQGVAHAVIDIVETFEGSEADGTHQLCHLVVGNGTLILLPVTTDVC